MYLVKLIINKIFNFLIFLNYNLPNINFIKISLKTAKDLCYVSQNTLIFFINIQIFNIVLTFLFNDRIKYSTIRKISY